MVVICRNMQEWWNLCEMRRRPVPCTVTLIEDLSVPVKLQSGSFVCKNSTILTGRGGVEVSSIVSVKLPLLVSEVFHSLTSPIEVRKQNYTDY